MPVSPFIDPQESISRCSRELLLVCTMAASLALCLGAHPVFTTPVLPLHTSGANIVDSAGKTVHLNAFNWYGTDSTDYVVAGLEIAPLQSIVSTIKNRGFNTVRVPFSNQMVESNPVVPNYALTANMSMEGETALTILDQVINALTSAGIMVILDDHVSTAGWCCSTTDGNELWYNSQYPQSNWIADWQTMAQRYQSNPMVIGTDLRNELRGTATWGGSASTDWHAAAELGGNAVLGVNPNLLIFVEGVNYAGDLSGVSSLPIQLNVANQLVYEAHDYGFWYSGLASYTSWVNTITPKWGYLVSGSNPQPLWIGEFGTCNTAANCVDSNANTDGGYWFNLITTYMQQYNVNWSYWAINGTESTGAGRIYGATETYGVLNATWNDDALPQLTSRLQNIMIAGETLGAALVPAGTPVTLEPGAAGTSTLSIVPQNGFTGTVNLSCAVSAFYKVDVDLPTCSVPSSLALSGNIAASAVVSVNTTGASASLRSTPDPQRVIPFHYGSAILACALLIAGNFFSWGKQFRLLFAAMLAVFAVAASPGCSSGGGSGSSSSPGTTPDTYTITVTGTAAGSAATTALISVVVQ